MCDECILPHQPHSTPTHAHTLALPQATQEFLGFMSGERRHIREGLLPDCSKVRVRGCARVCAGVCAGVCARACAGVCTGGGCGRGCVCRCMRVCVRVCVCGAESTERRKEPSGPRRVGNRLRPPPTCQPLLTMYPTSPHYACNPPAGSADGQRLNEHVGRHAAAPQPSAGPGGHQGAHRGQPQPGGAAQGGGWGWGRWGWGRGGAVGGGSGGGRRSCSRWGGGGAAHGGGVGGRRVGGWGGGGG